jgi:hypothetical protein
MSVLSITFLHAAVLRSFFRVFLARLPSCCAFLRDNSGRSHRMTHMLGESHSTAPHHPGASVISSGQECLALSPFDRHPVISRTYAFSFANPNVQLARITHKSSLIHISPLRMKVLRSTEMTIARNALWTGFGSGILADSTDLHSVQPRSHHELRTAVYKRRTQQTFSKIC